MSFFELVYDPDFTVNDMKAGDELIIVAPNGTRSAGSVVVANTMEIVIKDPWGIEWMLTETTAAEKEQCLIYPDMLNTVWTVRHRRLCAAT
jgi:hypothetical protein